MLTVTKLNVKLNDVAILKDISFSVPENSIVAIIGKNGSGKTTTLKAIDNLVPSNGEIRLNDTDITTLSVKQRAKIISYLPQTREAPAISGRLLVEHGRFPHLGFAKILSPKDIEIVNNVIKETGIEDLSHKKIDQMSGGEMQKVYIASVIAQQSKIALFDEPTNHLDLKSQIEILNLIKNSKKEDTITLVVMHDLLQAMSYADYVILVDDGEVKLSGKPDEVYSNPLIKEVFGYSIELDQEDSSLYPYKITK